MTHSHTLQYCQELARSKEGKCLSTRYINANSKLKWQCNKGHTWETSLNNIKNGTWCPHCAHKAKHTIEEMKLFAESKGGKCLSTKYVNANSKLKWQCKKSHKWEATYGHILSGTWCPVCGGHLKLDIEEMRELAKSMGGKCLSKYYTNNHTNLKWECKEKHTWYAAPSSIKMGSWCPRCAESRKGASQRGSIKDAQKLAEFRGGKCISAVYVNSQTNLGWECAEGHTWEATYANVKKGTWCQICSQGTGISERLCRAYFEHIFNEKFPKIKPKWLIGNKGKRLELDGYCEKLKLAFEYQGIQHYEQTKFFHKKRSFEEQQQTDTLKKRLCEEHEIVLIEIPDISDKERMMSLIIQECMKKGVRVPSCGFNPKEFNIYSSPKLKEMQEIAESRGGKCLSTKYVNANSKLTWQCKEKHIWEAVPSSVKGGTWCRICAFNKQRGIYKIKRDCKYCEKEFEAYPYEIKEGRKFCGKKCAYLFKKGKPTNKPSKKIKIECLNCGKTFYKSPSQVTTDKGKYCSRECYYKSKKGKPSSKRNGIEIPCQICGKRVYVPKARIKTAKFCSRVCQAKSKEGHR